MLGACDEARAAGLDGTKMPVEGFAIKTAPGRVFIVGHDDPQLRAAGTAWGVYEFLERMVGVRWYWPMEQGGRSVAAAKSLAVQPVWLEDAPVFRKREIWPPCGNSWNGGGVQLGPLQTALRSGDSWPIRLIVHSPGWQKCKDLTEGHPEMFQLRSDGTRNFDLLCYSNPRTLAQYLEHCEAVWTRGEKLPPGRTGIMGDAVTVSPNDMAVVCYCKQCQELWDPHGGEFGTASKILTHFVAQLAGEVKRRWPGKTVVYLPYLNYTLAPQGFTLSDNVEVQLCGMPGIAQYKEPDIARSEQQNLDRWYGMTGRRIQNWHYSCWPADRTKAPYQYPHVLQAYYQANRDKLLGSFINGTGDHWPRHHISLYCWMKLLWNPDFDVDAAIGEYCRRMYGPAAGAMRKLVALEIDGWEQSRWPDAVLSPKAIYKYSFPPQVVQQMKDLLKQARQAAAGSPAALARIDYFEQPFADFYKEFDFVVNGKGMRPIIAKKVPENPVIDGKLDEAVWKQAPAVTLMKFDAKEGRESEPRFKTEVKAVWTLDGLTFGFRMEEPDAQHVVQNIHSKDDALAYWQDCVEVFLDVTGRGAGDFYQFTVNAAGTVCDSHKTDVAWDLPGLKTKSYLGDGFWSMEIYFPLAGFPTALRPGTGVEWYGQLCRHRMDDKAKSAKGHENQKCNANFGGPNSNVADFAPIRFVE